MDIVPLAGMVTGLLITMTVVLTVGGVVLFRPLMKNLGNYLEARAEESRRQVGAVPQDWERLLDTMENLSGRLESMEERQDFTERLLSKPREGGREL